MEVESKYGDQVTFVGVPGLADEFSMARFLIDHDINFANVPDTEGVIWQRFGVIQQRTYVLINDDGTFERTGYGSLEQDVLDLIAR